MTAHRPGMPPRLLSTAALVAAAVAAWCTACSVRHSYLAASPRALDFGRNTSQLELTLSANAATSLSVALAASDPWLTILPDRLTLVPGENKVPVAVRIARHQMKIAGNAGSVHIEAPGLKAIDVSVTADVVLAADFSRQPAQAQPGQPVSFSDATRAISGIQEGLTQHWDFGDGTTSSERNPVHPYTAPGIYTVSLSVASQDLADTRTWEQCVEIVQPQPPQADFSVSTLRPAPGQLVQFIDLSVPGTGPIKEWLWDFGDGASSRLPSPSHTYSAAAVYDVYLTVSSPYGKDTEIKIGYIHCEHPSP